MWSIWRARGSSSTVLTALLLVAPLAPAAAQNYDLDARNVGMGAIGSTRNIADEHIAERRTYHRIGLPFGIFHIIANQEVFKYDSDPNRAFDAFRSMEYARNPFHFTIDRDQAHTGKDLVDDIIDSQLNRNLSVYRPFNPAPRYVVEGVGFPNWGVTLKSRKNTDATLPADERDADGYQGLYIGAGPYFTVTTETLVDPNLSAVLGGPTAISLPNTQMAVTHETEGQGAAALVFGYRLYIPHHTTGPRREGMYVYANVSKLFGFMLGQVHSTIHMDTDATGLLALHPANPAIVVDWLQAKHGSGRVIDLGMAATIGPWDFGVGINGIANEITWTNTELHRVRLDNFFDGSEMEEVDAPPVTEPIRVTVPINASTNIAYTKDTWSIAGEYSRRFNGNNIQSGFEYRRPRLEFRAGLRYARDRWHPAGGIGVNLNDRVGIDAAVFSTSTNVERIRTAAFAFSIRINNKPKPGEQPF